MGLAFMADLAKDALPALHEAIARETDEKTRALMERAVKAIELGSACEVFNDGEGADDINMSDLSDDG